MLTESESRLIDQNNLLQGRIIRLEMFKHFAEGVLGKDTVYTLSLISVVLRDHEGWENNKELAKIVAQKISDIIGMVGALPSEELKWPS
jgi:hypothetical protein